MYKNKQAPGVTNSHTAVPDKPLPLLPSTQSLLHHNQAAPGPSRAPWPGPGCTHDPCPGPCSTSPSLLPPAQTPAAAPAPSTGWYVPTHTDTGMSTWRADLPFSSQRKLLLNVFLQDWIAFFKCFKVSSGFHGEYRRQNHLYHHLSSSNMHVYPNTCILSEKLVSPLDDNSTLSLSFSSKPHGRQPVEH